jgi:hypothetical protein
MMKFRLPIVVLLTLSVLLVGAVRFLNGARTPHPKPNHEDVRTPVVIELFTSEGCSSCPPADALLQKLDQSQPVSGAELIVLSEHVDYWNHIGWTDPYSSHEYTDRQNAYANNFGLNTVYTPQMVVDGNFELVGSDERRVVEAVPEAARMKKAPVCVSLSASDHKNASIHVEAGPLVSSTDAPQSANVFLGIADDRDESQVSRGENAGRSLRHVAVLRDLTRIGTVNASDPFSRDLKLNLNSKSARKLRVVVIIQEPKVGKILGAALARLSG